MAVVVLGGLALSTALSLVPAAFHLVTDSTKARLMREAPAAQAAGPKAA